MQKVNQSPRNERHKRQAEIALDKIRLYYQIGQALHKQHPLNKELKKIFEPLNSDTQAKIKRFANPDRGGYTKDQVEELLKLCSEANKPFPLSFKLIERLLSIPRPLRERLEKEMVKKGWRRRELDHQITLLRPNTSWKGGRRVERLPSAKGVLPELWHMSKEWSDRASSITDTFSDALKDLDDDDRNRFIKATAMILKLKRSLDIYLQKVPPPIPKRKAPVPPPMERQ